MIGKEDFRPVGLGISAFDGARRRRDDLRLRPGRPVRGRREPYRPDARSEAVLQSCTEASAIVGAVR
jgi:hypothetical protein